MAGKIQILKYILYFILSIFSLRIDNKNFYYSTSNISLIYFFTKKNKFEIDKYKETIANLTTLLDEQKTQNARRGIVNYLIGSTMFAADTSPKFINPLNGMKLSMLPRPNKSCFPDSYIMKYLNKSLFRELCECVSIMVETHLLYQICFLQQLQDTRNDFYIKLLLEQLNTIQFVKEHIPSSLKVCDSIFTQCVIVGDTVLSSHGGIYPHLDDKDVITCIITLGEVTKGGATIYYSGLKEKNPLNPVLSVPFEHGRIQIGSFSTVVHGVEQWEGNRITLNFNIKEQIVAHFRNFGDKYYSQWVNSNYERKYFVAK